MPDGHDSHSKKGPIGKTNKTNEGFSYLTLIFCHNFNATYSFNTPRRRLPKACTPSTDRLTKSTEARRTLSLTQVANNCYYMEFIFFKIIIDGICCILGNVRKFESLTIHNIRKCLDFDRNLIINLRKLDLSYHVNNMDESSEFRIISTI